MTHTDIDPQRLLTPEERVVIGDYLAGKDAERQAAEDGWEWAVVEIFGHRSHAGRAREEEKFGSKMLRIDVPVKGDAIANGWETHWYGGSSIFSYTLTDQDSVMRANKPYEPPSRYQLPKPQEEATDIDYDDEVDGR